MALTKATIEILDDSLKGESGFPADGILNVQFNPTEYSLTKGAQFAEVGIPGIDSPILQFVRGQNEKLALDLFFDVTNDGMGEDSSDVTTLTKPFYQLVKIQKETHAPPRIQFSWGQGLAFKAVVESVRQKFTLFSPSGKPLRATLSVSLREYKDLAAQLTELNLNSPDRTKLRVVNSGDTLSSIAAEEYDDPRLWRVIANAPENEGRIGSPRRPRPGTVLTIPRLDDRSRQLEVSA